MSRGEARVRLAFLLSPVVLVIIAAVSFPPIRLYVVGVLLGLALAVAVAARARRSGKPSA